MSPSGESTPVISAVEPQDDYLAELQRLLDERPEIKWSLDSKKSTSSTLTKVHFTDTGKEFAVTSPQDLVTQAAALEDRGELSICIIENISADYVKVLGKELNISPLFFVDHATNPKKEQLWWSKHWDWPPPQEINTTQRVISNAQEETPQTVALDFFQSHPGHMDGVFKYHDIFSGLGQSTVQQFVHSRNHIRRHCFDDERWGILSNTRVSYCRSTGMYLFLVDAPPRLPSDIHETQAQAAPTLRFMCSTSRGGVEFPRLLQTLGDDHSIFEARYYGGNSRQASYAVLPCYPMMYLLASCIWEESLRKLDKEIKRISFKQIWNPKLDINGVLHDRRQDLAYIKAGLTETTMCIPADVVRFFEAFPIGWTSRTRKDNWQRLIDETTKLEGFFMETFQLCMSSVSVQDSRLGINQAQRGGQITLWALIYVPLSFVPGIFGMNIQQINGSGLNVWVCFVTLVPVVFITILVFLAVKLHGDRKAARKTFVQSTQV